MNCFKLIIMALVFGISYESNLDNRVYGGQNVEEGNLTYVVAIEMSEGKCTGCVIHEDWVLTAAHCVINGYKVLKPHSVKIVAGVVDMQILENAQQRIGRVILVHEKYAPKYGKPDLALIKVNESYVFNSNVNKIEFTTKPWPQNEGHTWEDCIAAGWGLTETGQPTKLQSLNTFAIHGKNACPCIVNSYVLKRYVCLPPRHAGVCFGDSGGALTCGGNIIGVAHMILDKRLCSFTSRPDRKIQCGNPNVYGIYIYTCPFLDWISARVPDVPGKPSSCIGSLSAIPMTRNSIFILYLFTLLLFNK